jgi:hypothetical protein
MKNESCSTGAITDGVSTSAIVIYGAILCIVLYFIFSRNAACLQYGLDGTSWILGFKAQAAREPFSQLGVDPLQGNFDAYFPVFREYFLPEALALMFKGTDASKAVTYTVYGMLMVFATYALARSVGISRSVAFLGGALFAATALPTTLSNLSWIHAIYNLVPHLAQVTCVTIMIAACFWAIEVGRPIFTLALGLIAVALVILSAVSYVTATILMLPTIALYGGVSIFASRVPADALARIVVAAACIIIIIPTLNGAGGSKFNADHRPFATNRSDQFKTTDNSIEEAQQPFAALRGFLDQPFRFENLQRRQPSRHREIIF